MFSLANILNNPQTTLLGIFTGLATVLAQFGIVIPESYKGYVTIAASCVGALVLIIHANDPKKTNAQ